MKRGTPRLLNTIFVCENRNPICFLKIPKRSFFYFKKSNDHAYQIWIRCVTESSHGHITTNFKNIACNHYQWSNAIEFGAPQSVSPLQRAERSTPPSPSRPAPLDRGGWLPWPSMFYIQRPGTDVHAVLLWNTPFLKWFWTICVCFHQIFLVSPYIEIHSPMER